MINCASSDNRIYKIEFLDDNNNKIIVIIVEAPIKIMALEHAVKSIKTMLKNSKPIIEDVANIKIEYLCDGDDFFITKTETE